MVNLLNIKNISLLALAALLLAAPAYAAGSPKQERDAAYARLLDNPADRPGTLEYAAINMRMSDYESSIPPLERILIREPDNAKIRLQIGVLYKSLGSKVLARQYLSEVKSDKKAEPKLVEQAAELLHGL